MAKGIEGSTFYAFFTIFTAHSDVARTGTVTPERVKRVEDFRIDQLRSAIRKNRVSFPSQVPVFSKHDRPDLQRKIVQLYFVLGWSCPDIAVRHGLIRQRVQQILHTWQQRAAQTGYIQLIPPPECLKRLRRTRLAVEVPLHAVLPANSAREISTSF